MLVRGRFNQIFLDSTIFIDECSKTRHILARLWLCNHVGRTITIREWYKEMADRAPGPYPKLFRM